MEAPRDDLTRSVPFELVRSDDNDGLTLEGYAAVFNSPTVINSWEGHFEEVMARGAFKKTISERTPVLGFEHGKHPLIGSLPIGSIKSLREDDHGLYVSARLHDNWLVEPVRDAIREQSISGMSFRFSVVKDQWQTRNGDIPLRTVSELKCPELGPVVYAAYLATSVSVRSRELAQLLTDDELRTELARLLMFGTPEPEAADGTSDERAATTEEPAETPLPGLTPEARDRVLKLSGVLT